MKYIHFVLVGLCIVLSIFVTPAYGAEVNAMIHYSETFVKMYDELALEQGYSIKIIDIGPTSGDSWIELYLNNNKIDTNVYFAKENAPYEYIRTVIDEDDEEKKETDYLIIRITPIEVVKEPLSVKLQIEQFLDPELDAAEYLILDKSKSIKIGTPLNLEEEYTLEASNLKDNTVTLTLSKNGYPVKEEKEVEKGDMFTYSKTVDGKPITIFIAKLDTFFEGTDSETVFLKQVSQRADVVVESDATITIKGASSAIIRDGGIAIISYTIENEDISEVKVLLDGEQIDHRSGLSTGTYSTVTETLNAGIHEVVLTTVASDGTMSTHTKTFTVEASIAAETASDIIEKISEDNETVGKVLGMPGFGSIITAAMIGIVFITMRRRRDN
ncbi:MAG: S-layer protein domain-containing protein [Methanosarcinaceae archaeon]|nr:S-layer protein domain-containing protein [Methanosarcinaceae archaeon]